MKYNNIKLIDAHTHAHFNAFKKDSKEIIERALKENIGMILVGTESSTSRSAVEFSNLYPDKPVFASVVLHPIHLERLKIDEQELGRELYNTGFTKAEKFDYAYYKKLSLNSKVVAIGETGLDYHWTNKNNKRAIQKQKNVFREQIELAIDMKKPLIVHCRKAHDDCIKILKEYFQAKTSKLNGDIHFFDGTLKEAREYIKMGFTLSFTGVITFKNAHYHRELVRNIPLDNILIETDAPYVTPEPFRGKRNEPLYVKYIAQKISKIKKIPLKEVLKITTETAGKVFRIM